MRRAARVLSEHLASTQPAAARRAPYSKADAESALRRDMEVLLYGRVGGFHEGLARRRRAPRAAALLSQTA